MSFCVRVCHVPAKAVVSQICSRRHWRAVGGEGLSGAAYSRARADATSLAEGKALEIVRTERQRFNASVVHGAVDFLLSRCDVMSWGTRLVECDGMFHRMPALVRKRQTAKLFEEYVDILVRTFGAFIRDPAFPHLLHPVLTPACRVLPSRLLLPLGPTTAPRSNG